MPRKTFNVEDFKNDMNSILLQTPDDQADYRQGIIDAVEFVLKTAKNYTGFIYLTEDDLEDTSNSIPGVYYTEDKSDFSFVGSDRTRVKYF